MKSTKVQTLGAYKHEIIRIATPIHMRGMAGPRDQFMHGFLQQASWLRV